MYFTEGQACVSTAREAGEREPAAQEATWGHVILLYFSLRSPDNKFSQATNHPARSHVKDEWAGQRVPNLEDTKKSQCKVTESQCKVTKAWIEVQFPREMNGRDAEILGDEAGLEGGYALALGTGGYQQWRWSSRSKSHFDSKKDFGQWRTTEET